MNATLTGDQNDTSSKPKHQQPAEVPGSAWGDRLRALKNVPPGLQILWESGPSVVTWSIVLRLLVAGLPALLGYISSWILGHVKLAIDRQALPPRFWWMVGAEVFLAVF